MCHKIILLVRFILHETIGKTLATSFILYFVNKFMTHITNIFKGMMEIFNLKYLETCLVFGMELHFGEN